MPSLGSARCMIYGGLSEEEYGTRVHHPMTRQDVARIYGVPEGLLRISGPPSPRWDVTVFQDSGLVPVLQSDAPTFTVKLPPGSSLQ